MIERIDTIECERDGVHFLIQRQERRDGSPFWVFNAERVCDGHYLPGQIVTDTDVTDMMDTLVDAWFKEHGSLAVKPEDTHCYACNAVLTSDCDTNYQFDNALWITLGGGYGMFVESESFMLVGDFWRSLPIQRQRAAMVEWLRTECKYDGEINDEMTDGTGGCPMPLPTSLRDEWEDWFDIHRDDRVVICHECAHAACEALPWLARLIDPQGSHSHRISYLEAHPMHEHPFDIL